MSTHIRPCVQSMCILASGGAVAAALLIAPAGAAGTCQTIETVEGYATTETAPEGATCATHLGQDGRRGASCYWTFEFRDAAALELVARIWADVTACRAGERLTSQNDVNHPDSYDLREWAVGSDLYHVSVKDKGALAKTLVFLRVEQAD